MADRVIFNSDELDALWGLPLLAQVVYFRGIRPEMDYQTGLVGVRTSRTKKISYQSISEAVEVHPHQGRTGAGKPSRGELRAAVNQLVKVGLVEVLSESSPSNRQLIFKCVLADVGYSVQKKDDTFTTIKTTGLQPETQPVYDQDEKAPEDNDSNGLGSVDQVEESENTTDSAAKTQQTESQKHDTPRSTENKTYTHNSRASRESVIPDDFGIDEQVKVYLRMSRVSEDEALVYLPEFKMANLTSQHRSANWPAEFVKYCCVQKRYTESFEQRMAEKNKVKNKTPLRLVGTAGDSGDGSHGFNTED